MSKSDVDHAWKLMKSIRFCMLTTGIGSASRSRPMGAFVRPEELAVYFFADRRAQIDDEIRQQSQVQLAFADPHRQKYVSISGIAEISVDPLTLKRLWSIPAKVWWHKPENPNICIIKVVLQEGEYWDAPGNLVSNLNIAFALATGRYPDAGEHKQVKFQEAANVSP